MSDFETSFVKLSSAKVREHCLQMIEEDKRLREQQLKEYAENYRKTIYYRLRKFFGLEELTDKQAACQWIEKFPWKPLGLGRMWRVHEILHMARQADDIYLGSDDLLLITKL